MVIRVPVNDVCAVHAVHAVQAHTCTAAAALAMVVQQRHSSVQVCRIRVDPGPYIALRFACPAVFHW